MGGLVAGLVAAVLAVLACAPLFHGHWLASHERNAYPIRLVEYVQGWRTGQLFPRWCPDLYGGYGAPFFNYYAPGVFTVAAVPMLLGFGPTTALKLAVVLFSALGALGVFALCHGETRRADAGFLAAVAYVLAPYRFVDLYVRGDLAEYAAIALLPYPLWLCRAVARARPAAVAPTACALAASLAAVICTHTLTGLWAAELATLVAAVSLAPAWRAGARRRVGTTVVALGGACLLSAVYALPALAERSSVHLERMTTGRFATARHLVEPWRFVRFGYFTFATDGGLGARVRMAFSVGEPLVVAAVVALGAAVGGRAVRGRVRASAGWWLLVAGLLVVMTPAAAPLWAVVPFGRFAQFPWRLLGFVAVCGAAAISSTWAAVVAPDARGRWVLAVALAAVATGGLGRYDRVQGYHSRAEVPATPAEVAAEVWAAVAAHEYLPRGVPGPPDAPRDAVAVPVDERVTVVTARAEGRGFRFVARAATAASVVDVQTYWFPGWTAVTRGGPTAAVLTASPAGLLRVRLPRAGVYDVAVVFGATPVRWFATALTWLAVLGLYPALRACAGRSPR